jgi:hypothetical protein
MRPAICEHAPVTVLPANTNKRDISSRAGFELILEVEAAIASD